MADLFQQEELAELDVLLATEAPDDRSRIVVDIGLKVGAGGPEFVLPDMAKMMSVGVLAIPEGAEELASEEIALSEDELEVEEEEEVEVDVDVSGAKKAKEPPPPPPPTGKKPPPPPQPRRSKMPPPVPASLRKSPNWSDAFFDDDYLMSIPPPSPKVTELEVNFLKKNLQLEEGARVLDVGCGDGRHCITLAQQGMTMVGIDRSVPFLLQASKEAQSLGLPITFVKKDLREYENPSPFDAVYCIGGSFGYYPDEENLGVLEKIASFVKIGGRVVLEGINRDFAVSVLPSRIWWEGNGCMIMDESHFDNKSSRIRIKRNMAYVSGKQRNHDIHVRCFSFTELSSLVQHFGFQVLKTVGGFVTPEAFLGQMSPSLLMVLQRVK